MEQKRSLQVGVVYVALMALLMPAAYAEDCAEAFMYIDGSVPGPVDVSCVTGDIIIAQNTLNLLPGSHISTGRGGGQLIGSTDAIINISGGVIDSTVAYLSTSIVTVYGSNFAVNGSLLNPTQDQIVNPGPGVMEFVLTGTFDDGSDIVIYFAIDPDAVLNLGLQQTAPEIEVFPALLEWDFGDVEVGESATVLVQIYNYGTADLNVSSVILTGDADIAITSGPTAPLVIAPSTSIGVDFEVTFTPSAEGASVATIQILSDDEDEPEVYVDLSGVGIITEVPPTQQIQNILDYFDTSVADGTLIGYGPGNSASKRLNALRNMIEAASDLINAGAYEQAIEQLESIAKKTDGVSKPQDFVVGDAVSDLNTMINDLIASLAP